MNKDADMATLFQQLQAINPGLAALEASDKARFNPTKTNTESDENEKAWSGSKGQTMHDPLFSCSCFDDPNEDYRSLVRKPEYLL